MTAERLDFCLCLCFYWPPKRSCVLDYRRDPMREFVRDLLHLIEMRVILEVIFPAWDEEPSLHNFILRAVASLDSM